MALFPKPPAKKPDSAADRQARPRGGGRPRTPVSARDVAVQAQGRRALRRRPHAEPAGDISMTGASLIDWSPVRTTIEVGQTNPGLVRGARECGAAVRERPDRSRRGICSNRACRTIEDAQSSPLAWLALFDLQQRPTTAPPSTSSPSQYVVQFERSPPSWEEGASSPRPGEPEDHGGRLCGAHRQADRRDGDRKSTALRRRWPSKASRRELDLSQVPGFDDAGARLLADALARSAQVALQR